MNDILFYKSFGFKVVSLTGNRHTDNSRGIDGHFFARMRCGSGRIITNEREELLLREGDIFYLPKGLRYNSYWYGDPEKGNRVEWESYRFTVIPDSREVSYKMQILTVDKEGEVMLDTLYANREVSAYSVGIFYLFCHKAFPTMERGNTDTKEAIFLKIKDYISENRDFSVPELARYLGMSESGVYAFLKRYGGTTPIELKNKIKAEEAVALLESTDLSVEEISTRLGFGNAAYFREIIKKNTGKTPLNIRRSAEKM